VIYLTKERQKRSVRNRQNYAFFVTVLLQLVVIYTTWPTDRPACEGKAPGIKKAGIFPAPADKHG
jgi:hypothetical protein